MISFITSKPQKYKEAKAIVPILERVDLDLIEIQSDDVKKIIKYKLDEASTKIDGDIMVDDVSLDLEAFNGFPGPYARYMYEKVDLSELAKMILHSGKVGIKFICNIGLLLNGKQYFFEGVVEGKVVMPRGDKGWGFEPIHMPNGYDKTIAEMTMEEKNMISHRAKALEKVKEFLVQNSLL